jgi:hypothetical protein
VIGAGARSRVELVDPVILIFWFAGHRSLPLACVAETT